MTVNVDKPSRKKSRKNGKAKRRSNVEVLEIQTDENGQFYQHPQRGRIEVVTLYCDCGRSILINPKDIERTPAICGLCSGVFRWQQLMFDVD